MVDLKFVFICLIVKKILSAEALDYRTTKISLINFLTLKIQVDNIVLETIYKGQNQMKLLFYLAHIDILIF